MTCVRLFPGPSGALSKPRNVALRREEVFVGRRKPGWIWRPAFTDDDNKRDPHKVFQDRRGAVRIMGCRGGGGSDDEDDGEIELRLTPKAFRAFCGILDRWVRSGASFGGLCHRRSGYRHSTCYYHPPGIDSEPVVVKEDGKESPRTRIKEGERGKLPVADLTPLLDLQNGARDPVARLFRWDGDGADVLWTRWELVLIYGRRLSVKELALALTTNLTIDHNIKKPPRHLLFDAEDASFLVSVDRAASGAREARR